MLNGREVAQSIHDWIERYAKVLNEDPDHGADYANLFSGFAGILQTMIDEGVYGK